MKKVLFLGSKPIGYNCLKYLFKSSKNLNIEIIGVLSNENLRFNSELSIVDFCNQNAITFIDDLDAICELDIDILISVQYHQILKSNHINCAKEIAVNLHMAPLPEYRGCNQFSFAIYNKSKVFGATLHRLEAGIDSGDIIFESRFDLPPDWSVKRLYDETEQQSFLLFKNNVHKLIKGDYTLHSQSSYLNVRDSNIYYRKDIRKLKSISLDATSDEIISKVNATAMPGFEPPFVLHNNKKYYIIPEEIYTKS